MANSTTFLVTPENNYDFDSTIVENITREKLRFTGNKLKINEEIIRNIHMYISHKEASSSWFEEFLGCDIVVALFQSGPLGAADILWWDCAAMWLDCTLTPKITCVFNIINLANSSTLPVVVVIDINQLLNKLPGSLFVSR